MKRHLAPIVRMVGLFMVLGGLVFNRLVLIVARMPGPAFSALDGFAEGLCAAPTEEKKGAKENRAYGSNDYASNRAGAEIT